MPARSYHDLIAALRKGNFPQALYLYGAADILKDEAVQLLVDGVLDPSFRDLNYEQRTAAELDPEALVTLLGTLAMFGDKRVVVVRAIEGLKKKPKVREALIAVLEHPSPDTHVVLIQSPPPDDARGKDKEPDSELVRLVTSVAADDLDHDATVEWVERRARDAGIRFAEGAANHLATATHDDLSALKSELEKFSALGGEQAITLTQVGDIVGIHPGETLMDWRNAVMSDDTARAFQLLGPVLMQSGNSGVRLVATLGTGLTALSVARARYDKGERGPALVSALFNVLKTSRVFFGIGNWGEETRLWATLAPRWPRPRLRAALRAALAADQALKETRISDEQGVLTDLILNLAPIDRAASRTAPVRGRTPAGV
jgi:DNA polymerase-3 subunit delta